MNDAQPAPGASLLPDSTGLITSIHFVLIALFAVAAVAIILIGIARKRRRRHAEKVVEERIEQAETAPDELAPASAQPAPVKPAPAQTAPAQTAPVQPAPVQPDHATSPDASTLPTAAVPAVAPQGEAAPMSPATDDPAAGPLTQLKGLGPKVAARLAELGITSVGQLAALSDAEAAALDADLGPFAGRMARDRWPEQARLLAAGDRAGFEAAFGKL